MELAGELRRLSKTMTNHPDDNGVAQAVERLVRLGCDVQFMAMKESHNADHYDIHLTVAHIDARPTHYHAELHDLEPDFASALACWSEELTRGASADGE